MEGKKKVSLLCFTNQGFNNCQWISTLHQLTYRGSHIFIFHCHYIWMVSYENIWYLFPVTPKYRIKKQHILRRHYTYLIKQLQKAGTSRKGTFSKVTHDQDWLDSAFCENDFYLSHIFPFNFSVGDQRK